MRQAERALFDLRRGLQILMRHDGAAVLLRAAEGADDAAVDELQTLGGAPVRQIGRAHV